jgi:hypothetical protein
MNHQQREAISKIAGLILTNALIFQEVLSKTDSRVKSLQEFQLDADPIVKLIEHWQFILNEVNYYPIFYVANRLLKCLASDKSVTDAIKKLITTARRIVGWRASLRHDLAGRIYHRLLTDAKYLGAYYTSIPAAFLLLKLALQPDAWNRDWSDVDKLKDFIIADLACGTGTLLMAAADVVTDNHIRACVQSGKQPSLDALHDMLVHNVLYGFDVLDAAIHLTASTLALRGPDIPINVTNLRSLPLGGPTRQLGSLEFLESPQMKISSLYTQPERAVGKQEKKASSPTTVHIPNMDLCVMNPPFTRSVGGNRLFGNLPDSEREPMQQRLRSLVGRQGLEASITAGLGSVFTALADRYLKDSGRLALVLPRALLSGEAWKKTRQLIGQNYHLEWLIVSHEPNHWNFSENTDLSEVLVVTRKRQGEGKNEIVSCVNLWRQPKNAIEALSVARSLVEGNPPDIVTGQGALNLTIGDKKVGEALSVPWAWLRERSWGFPCAFAQSELVRVLFCILEGKLYLPGKGTFPKRGKIKLCPLSNLGVLGFDRRDIHDGFALAKSKTAYPAVWGHDSTEVATMLHAPNAYLEPLSRAKKGRPLRQASALWQKSGRILIAERLWLKTMGLTSVRVTQNVLSNVWWSIAFNKSKVNRDDAEKSFVLWLNSTLGLLILLGHREETRGAWVGFKKPVLEDMRVLDVSKLSAKSKSRLAQAFDKLASSPLRPFPEIADDPIRAVIDEAVADALNLPDFGILRELLAREPILCLTLDQLLP